MRSPYIIIFIFTLILTGNFVQRAHAALPQAFILDDGNTASAATEGFSAHAIQGTNAEPQTPAQLVEEQNALRKQVQMATSSAQRQSIRDKALEIWRERSAQLKTALSARRKEVIQAYLDRISKRFLTGIDRLSRLSDRLNSRISKEAALGINTERAANYIVISKNSVAEARSGIESALAAAQSALNTDDPHIRFVIVEQSFIVAKENMNNARKSLLDAVGTLKQEAAAATTETATSTTPSIPNL